MRISVDHNDCGNGMISGLRWRIVQIIGFSPLHRKDIATTRRVNFNPSHVKTRS